MQKPSQLHRVKAIAAQLDVHVTTVYRLIDAGVLPAVRVGFGKGALRVTDEAFQAYLRRTGLVSGLDESGVA